MQLSREMFIFCLERQNLMFKIDGTKGGCLFLPCITFPCEAGQIRHCKTMQHAVPDYYSHLKNIFASGINERTIIWQMLK